MITLDAYFGNWLHHPDVTPQRMDNAEKFLDAVSDLETDARADGVLFPDNPATHSGVAGLTYGGFRPTACKQGAAHSSHKEARGVDRYDPDDRIDAWCLANQDKLVKHGLYIEAPEATPKWSHWTDRAPISGRRVFLP